MMLSTRDFRYPSEERDYCTLVTMGMGAHRMNVPEELAEYKLCLLYTSRCV